MAGAARTPVYKKRREAWKQVLYDKQEDKGLIAQRLALLDTWGQDPWAFLTARDLDGTPIIWTADERDEELPVKPFPEKKLYLRDINKELWAYRFVGIDKIRQKYITTLSCLNILWFILFKEEREVFVSRIKEESAQKMINDKIREPWKRLPAWVQRALPITLQPYGIITATETGSTVTGVSQNFAVSDARGPTASLILVDEAAFQDAFPGIYQAILPMASRLWFVTTANIGNPGAALCKELLFDGRPGAGEA